MKKSTHPASNSTTAPASMPNTWLWRIIVFAAFGIGGLFTWFFNLPFEQAHAAVSWLSPNRHLAKFTVEVFTLLQPIGKMLAVALLAAGLYLLIFPSRTRKFTAKCLPWLTRQLQRLPGDCTRLWEYYRPHRAGWFYLTAVLLLMCAAILVRLLFLSYPMRYDESYSVVVFAMRPWINLISDYSLPNNHIFHTILVKLSINLFGTALWAVRLPAFINGILCVPAGYLLARQLYGRISALLSAGLIAALPILISYSTDSRGYSQYILYSLILFSLTIYLSKHANLAGWGLFVIIAAVGMYTVPFMLYPLAGVCLWLVASAAAGETCLAYGSFGSFLKYLFPAGVLIMLLTIILYSPVVFIGTGLNSLIGNPFVTQLSWVDFLTEMEEGLKSTWINWNDDLPVAIQVLLAAGVMLSLGLHRKISQVKVPFQISLLISNLMVVVLMRRSMDRTWLYLIPFWLIWACGGLFAPLKHLKPAWQRIQAGLVIGCLLIASIWSYQRVHTYFPGWQADPGKVELAAKYLNQNLESGDAVAVAFPYDAQYWYYLGQLEVPDECMHQIEEETHERVFAVVNKHYADTPALVLQAHDLSPEEYQVDEAELVFQVNDQDIYLCLHR